MCEIANQPTQAPEAEELDDFAAESSGRDEPARGGAATDTVGGVGATSIALDNPVPHISSGV